MGGGSGSSKPRSAEESRFECPEFLKDFTGKGKYNIGFAGSSGCGKSSFLNEILGANLAATGRTECTPVPESYQLPLDDPRGLFEKFIDRLPEPHRTCVSNKLRSVTLWDLPGSGTRLHPAASYVREKGLRYFDYVVLFVGDRVSETDHSLLKDMAANNVKYFLVRSKVDVTIGTFLKEKKDELKRKLSLREKFDLSGNEMNRIRAIMVQEIRQSFTSFHGDVYLLAAMEKVDDESPHFDVIKGLIETRLAFDRLLLDIIEDRHEHNLRHFFDNSLYGKASRAMFNLFFHNAAAVDDSLSTHEVEHEDITRESEVHPEDSVSQISSVRCGYASAAESDWVRVPVADTSDSVITEEEASSLVSVPNGEPHCFLPESVFTQPGDCLTRARDLQAGSQVLGANGGMLCVKSIEREKSQNTIYLRAHTAELEVTPNHRIMIPAAQAEDSIQAVRARTLQTGDRVVCSGGIAQPLVEVRVIDKEVDVFAITFNPDEPVCTFLEPDSIQSMGVRQCKKRRGRRHLVVPDTDSELAVPSAD